MKKFLGYMVVFGVGVAYGSMHERLRNIGLLEEAREENDKKQTDMFGRFLSEEP